MLPSSTVENYLKAIYLGAGRLTPPQRLLPMGQLASALGVVPGTATTMVKALAESGLVEYEPYSGVALTPPGHKLAALVLRRHRLIELFLVRVMGYAWDEVHDEAEQLEHVVSDRLIDRMDEMLGRPETDPHGDPIPNAEGHVKPQESQTLMTCPIGAPVTVTRVVDQDSAFLRFVDRHHLKPGAAIQVEERDESADSVRVRGEGNQLITIGTRAASKLLVQVARTAMLLLLAALPAIAQESKTAARGPRTPLFSIPTHGCQAVVPPEANVFARRVPIPLFGWKGQHATLLSFTGDAYRNEMGITNDIFPAEVAYGVTAERMRACDRVRDPEDIRDPRTQRRGIDNFTSFMRFLAPPARDTAAIGGRGSLDPPQPAFRSQASAALLGSAAARRGHRRRHRAGPGRRQRAPHAGAVGAASAAAAAARWIGCHRRRGRPAPRRRGGARAARLRAASRRGPRFPAGLLAIVVGAAFRPAWVQKPLSREPEWPRP